MLEKILRLYTTAQALDVRSPTPHLFGPPGCGKSTIVEQAAELLGVNLWVINVSRISPLDLEGIQMPTQGNTKLELLTARYWTQLKEGDIVLFDEFLRGFPEVYNGLLDIITARQVGGFKLPKVFFIAASNSVATYDKALEDRLMHIPVEDARRKVSERKRLAKLLIDYIGLAPEMLEHSYMNQLIDEEVLPMYEVLDQIKQAGQRSSSNVSTKGHSIRNLIGQARLREVQNDRLIDVIEANNTHAITASQYQYVILLSGKNVRPAYLKAALALRGSDKLTELQEKNLELNLQLIELEQTKQTTEEGSSEHDFF